MTGSSCMAIGLVSLLAVVTCSEAFTIYCRTHNAVSVTRRKWSSPPLLAVSNDDTNVEDDQFNPITPPTNHRRTILQSLGTIILSPLLNPNLMSANAEEPTTMEAMKTFIDPMGYFSIRIPQRFFVLRRSSKGDLPDAKKGEGRRGASIFTSGDMSKAEVLAIERFPTEVFLRDEGIDASGDLSTFTSLGKPEVIAYLLNRKREKDKTGQSQLTTVVPNSASLSEDGKTLTFSLRTKVEVQKPELLMEQYGVSELIRVTLAKADLHGEDGNIMVCYASALERDFQGVDGLSLKEAVRSFTVMDRSGVAIRAR